MNKAVTNPPRPIDKMNKSISLSLQMTYEKGMIEMIVYSLSTIYAKQPILDPDDVWELGMNVFCLMSIPSNPICLFCMMGTPRESHNLPFYFLNIYNKFGINCTSNTETRKPFKKEWAFLFPNSNNQADGLTESAPVDNVAIQYQIRLCV